MKLRVWWAPQVPCELFFVNVKTVQEGVMIMVTLAEYDKFQFEKNIKPDYSSAGGLEMFDPNDKEENSHGSWTDWYDDKTGEDDPHQWLIEQN